MKKLFVKCSTAMTLLFVAGHSYAAEGESSSIFDSVNLDGVQDFVLTTGALIIAIALGTKGIDKAKQFIFKV